MKSIRLFIQLSRPLYVLSAILVYLLGISLNHYLTGLIDWRSLLYGLIWIILLLLAGQYLNEYFDPQALAQSTSRKHTPFSGVTGAIGPGKLARPVALWAGLACLAFAASITIRILPFLLNKQAVLFIYGIMFFAELFYALPPFRLVSSGYGELLLSITIVAFVPAIAFLMQGHGMHRLLVLSVFPLTTLHISMLLALEFPDYAADNLQEKRNALTRVGWQRGMLFHNVLLLLSFVLFAMAFILGLPLSVAWPIVFVLPIALYQVWLMNRIAEGAKPNWNMLTLISIATFILSTYILTFSFWIH
jgi:1,4-dihydroxy-2-naphthoate octaprenyltransferase